jgi:hypothetical protein
MLVAGMQVPLLKPGQGAAIVVGALASLGICAAGAAIAKRTSGQRSVRLSRGLSKG